MSARMNLTVSLRGPDLLGVARAVQAKGWLPVGMPLRLELDEQSLGSREKWFEAVAERAKLELRATFADDSLFMLSPATAIVKLDRAQLDLDLQRFVEDLATIPFETAVLAPRRFRSDHPEGWWHGRGLTGAHYQAGWGIALRGAGHLHLVSRRFITHGGPWRVFQAANDTTLFQFHDLAAVDPMAAWGQAQPCVERLTYQPGVDACGLIDVSADLYAPSGAKYDAASRTLWVAAGDRTIPPSEMRDAAEDRFNARVKPGKWRALEKIAFVFPSEARARVHLQDLWLRDLECWYETGGRRVRLDDKHAPAPPPATAWDAPKAALQDPPTRPPSDPPAKPPIEPPRRPPVAPPRTQRSKPSSPPPALVPKTAEDTPAPKVSAFAEAVYLPEMKRNDARTKTLNDAIGTLSAPDRKQVEQVAFAIAKLGSTTDRVDYAGHKENEMSFSASLLKVALLYASFELVARVNKLAPTLTATSPADFFSKVSGSFAQEVRSSVPFIPPGDWREVKFAEVLAATEDAPGKYSVRMRKTPHRDDLVDIFARQRSDDGARNCVRRLGFSYVNGALAAGGFLSVKNKSGIWLATDYLADGVPDGWPFVYVPVSTGGRSSVAMTALAMAHLFTAMHQRRLVDPASSDEMIGIFSRGPRAAWLSLTTTNPASMSFAITGAKVGHLASADAKVGVVKSEAAFLKRKRDDTPFLAVWQNLAEGANNDDTIPVYRVIDEVVKTWP